MTWPITSGVRWWSSPDRSGSGGTAAARGHRPRGARAVGTRESLVVNCQAPALSATLGRGVARALAAIARRTDPLANEPHRSFWTPDAVRANCWRATISVAHDDDLLTLAERLRIEVKNRRSLRVGWIAVADR